MKRSDFPLPYTTGLVDLNSEGAYADQGMELRCYPRFMPIPYRAISPRGDRLVLEPWRKNMQLYPQLYFLLGRDVPIQDTAAEPTVLAVGMGLASSDDGVEMASPNPAPRDKHMCYWYSLYSDNSQVLAQNMAVVSKPRSLKITLESPTLGTHVFDQGQLQFDPEELVREMNHLIPFRKYDLVSLGAADKPISLPMDKKFRPGEVITLSCPELGRLEITVEDLREPGTTIRGWTPRPFFLEQTP